ncbi:SusC/RagA family TonB-linked outer membrane protein [Parapedobacter indicus]|uniref:TonB-linked outer membrane protein, SusC/RagA family n=1 Tax=Parapedobacter indicus TaxID=1477437 RepID=A0A1I3H4P8_9SPHI|nr:SusC/RagA family TonB-linked outer membrane protein [Parapedobacter indicus]PPL02895.1 TonB-linked SusC/RagA family outer membrane protein [Parapedobacter indicus]SFI30661.1 TonB-linked outer membrane protein, SusC/RagA family [Parapedobacter indicus]
MKTNRHYIVFSFVLLLFFIDGKAFTQTDLSKRLSLNIKNVELISALTILEKEADVKFAYSAESLPGHKRLTLTYSEVPLSVILDDISEKNDLKYEVTGQLIVISRNLAKQQRTVSGTVTTETGEPLAGVSVNIKGTQLSTSTDENGHFSLSLAEGSGMLVFSSVGYITQEIDVNEQSSVRVVLEQEEKTLNEIVVVGYGTQKKSVVTGAISSVKSEDLQNQQIGRVEQALQGRTSGLTIASSSGAPGSAATVRVRGATSLNEGASDPLYVVDGVVVDIGGIDYLNPSDIESIEVLKDAASAAIYGARSSAGVILVTTKKGSSGAVRLSYNGYLGTQAPAKKLSLLNATQYATLMNEQAINGGGNSIFSDPESLGRGTDWQDAIFNNGALVQNHEFSLSGGGEKSTFYSSVGFFDQNGIVATEISNFKRINIRLNSTHKIADWLTIGENVGYSRIKNLSGVSGNTDFGGPLSGALMMDPTTPTLITDPSEIDEVPYSTQPVVRDELGNPYGISKYVAQQVTNPLAYIRTRDGNYSWSDDIVGNAYVEIIPLAGLRFRSTVGTRLSYSGGESFTPLYYLNSNQFTTQTSFARNRQQALNWNLENTLSYGKQVGEHDFSILLGQGAYSDNNSSGLSVTYFNLPVNTFKDASMNYSTASDNIQASGYEGITHTVSSLFGRLSYNFAEKYLFTGILRRDGSSRFGSNNKFGYFPSASVGWVVTQEDFFPMNSSVDFLKIRASYGITGNDVLGNFRYISTVGGGRNYIFGDDIYHIGYSPDAPANPDLRWEETSQLNVGFDAILFKNFDLTFDWFKKKTTDILQVVQLPNYVGSTGSSYGNVADMENKGVELELGYRKTLGNLRLNIRGNISYLDNSVSFLGDGKSFLDGGETIQSTSYPITRTAVGYAIGSFYGFETLGIFQNQQEINSYVNAEGNLIQPAAQPGDFIWADLDSDGAITADDRTFIGDPTPNWSFGFTLNLAWKDFDFLMFGQGVAGNEIYQGLRRLDIPTANWQTDAWNRWHGEGTSTSYPRLTTKDVNKNFSNPSVFHLQRGDYFRIKTLQVGYTLPAKLVDPIGLAKIRVYVSSNNLWTITGYTGYDPEIGGGSYGIDRAVYPQSRSFLFGANLSF